MCRDYVWVHRALDASSDPSRAGAYRELLRDLEDEVTQWFAADDRPARGGRRTIRLVRRPGRKGEKD